MLTTDFIVLALSISFTLCFSFFFNDTATTEIYTLSLHDALPIFCRRAGGGAALLWDSRCDRGPGALVGGARAEVPRDRKSTRLNSSHANISYAVFCLKKKKK